LCLLQRSEHTAWG